MLGGGVILRARAPLLPRIVENFDRSTGSAVSRFFAWRASGDYSRYTIRNASTSKKFESSLNMCLDIGRAVLINKLPHRPRPPFMDIADVDIAHALSSFGIRGSTAMRGILLPSSMPAIPRGRIRQFRGAKRRGNSTMRHTRRVNITGQAKKIIRIANQRLSFRDMNSPTT